MVKREDVFIEYPYCLLTKNYYEGINKGVSTYYMEIMTWLIKS